MSPPHKYHKMIVKLTEHRPIRHTDVQKYVHRENIMTRKYHVEMNLYGE